MRSLGIPFMNIGGRQTLLESIVGFGPRFALILGWSLYFRSCVKRLVLGSVRVVVLRVIVFVPAAVVLLMHLVAMAEPSRDGRRENTGGVDIRVWLLLPLLPTAASLYLRGELPW
jgi:hypothetical protein